MAQSNEPEVANAANVGQIRNARAKQKDIELQEKEDVKKILDLPEGRRFLWRLLGHCRLNQSIFEPNSRMAYNSGVQDVGHFILGEIIKSRPEAYLQMMRETQETGQ